MAGTRGTTRRRRKRRSWRQRLRSEPWRHSSALLAAWALASVLCLVLILTDVLSVTQPDGPLDIDVVAPVVLTFFALYGPIYLLMSQYAWRGLTGGQLRNALLNTMPPAKGLVRDLLLGTPAQMSTTAAMLSLAAVYFAAIRPHVPVAVLLISLGCVCGSWVLVMASFSIEYAREWAESDGFEFPGEDELVYSDFVYLSAQTSTTYSSSDVTTANRRARRLITIHAITAFIFATVIVAFLVAIVLNTIAD